MNGLTDEIEGPFASARAKIRQGFTHAEALRVATDQYAAAKPWAVELDGRYKVHCASLTWKEPMPSKIMLLAGDAIHNFRAALDHCVWELWIAHGGAPDEKNISFPIGDDEAAFRRSLKNLSKLSPFIGEFLSDIEPYPTGKDYELYHLHKLDIYDKHRFINIGAAEVTVTGLKEHTYIDSKPGYHDMPPVTLRISSSQRYQGMATHYGRVIAATSIKNRDYLMTPPFDFSKASGNMCLFIEEHQPYEGADINQTIFRLGAKASSVVHAFIAGKFHRF